MVDHVFILAGGSGTRLWPASRKAHPKQFLEIVDGKSLLQLTIERAQQLHVSGKIFIITLKDQVDGILDVCSKIPEGGDNIVIIPEPCARNTAPAIGLAALYVSRQYPPGQTALVLAADHLISPVEVFKQDVEQAETLSREGLLVTFGIPPTRPATGYGYIEEGEPVSTGAKVKSFKEKPGKQQAEAFLKAGNYFWNSGMFIFQVSDFWHELKLNEAAIADSFEAVQSLGEDKEVRGMKIACDTEEIAALYRKMKGISIDYAVMERSSRSGVVRTNFLWNDIGSWDEVSKLEDMEQPDLVEVDGSGNFVFSDLPVALCGVEDLIVVVKNGTVLICRKGSSQKVKTVVEQLKTDGREELL